MNILKQLITILLITILLMNKLLFSKRVIKNLNNSINYILKNNQLIYKKMLLDENLPIIICTGSAGTGKTMITCYDAIEKLNKGIINKIIITRPTVTIEEDLGFLPGDIQNKLYPFLIPIYDYFLESYTKEQILKMIKDGIIEIAPLAFMRGRTFKNSYIIADEMQNSTPSQFKMLLTRIGTNTKMVITGDLQQNDINITNGLEDFINLLKFKYNNDYNKIKLNGFGLVNLENNCIQRHLIINNILSIYGE